jgi:hypothetical protein
MLKWKYYFLFCVVLKVNICCGQSYKPFLSNNKYWTIFHLDGAAICYKTGGEYYYFDGDTLSQGVNYKILRYNIIQSPIGVPFCPPYSIDNSQSYISSYFREDTISQKVYFKQSFLSPEELLFDYSLQIGDTLFPRPACPFLIVDSVGSTTLNNGSSAKIIYLNSGEYMIESIGGSQGFFPCLVDFISIRDEITCVMDGGVNIYGVNCLGFTGVYELNENGIINFGIDNNILFWEIDATYKSNNYKVELVSSNGSVAYSEICNVGKSSFSVANLPKGIYFLRITTMDKCYSRKIKI